MRHLVLVKKGFSFEYTSQNDACTSSTVCICAERRLINHYIREAQKHSVAPYKIASWIHRKTGGTLTIYRNRADGSHGCSIPCIFCKREILKLGLRVQCCLHDGQWFVGYLDDDNAPCSKLTSGQRRNGI